MTGAAGFIGFHLARRLLDRGDEVIGLDNLNDYYDVSLKEARLERLMGRRGFRFYRLDLADRADVADLFAERRPDVVVNLAAQVGARHSVRAPHAYADSNLLGFVNVLEGCRRWEVKHLVFASSSSVYGANTRMPFSVHDAADHPVSLYGATKRANELMAHSYSHLYGMPVTGLRFFTVYGPWGRPDMALFLFTRAMLAGEPISVFNHGRIWRDFTYIDDVVEGVVRIIDRAPDPDPGSSYAPYRIFNIGNNNPVELSRLIEVLEDCLNIKAKIRSLPFQPGDLPATCADVDDLIAYIGFKPHTPIEVGVARFVEWYRSFIRSEDDTCSHLLLLS